jgi:uncharacterized protein YdcH (DUF465 family)
MNHNISYSIESSLLGTSQAAQRYLWLRDHIVARRKGIFLRKAEDADDLISTAIVNRDAALREEATRLKDEWLMKAKAVWPDEPTAKDIARLARIEGQQQVVGSQLVLEHNKLDNAIEYEKAKAQAEASKAIAQLEAESQNLSKEWRAGMRKLRLPVDSSDAEMRACEWVK